MKILYSSLERPYPTTSGHRLHIWSVLRALYEEGHKVTLISFLAPQEVGEDEGPFREICELVDFIPSSPARSGSSADLLRRLQALVSPLPYGAWRLESEEFRRRTREHLARESYDVVICDEIYACQNLPGHLSVPVLIDTQNIMHMISQRYLAQETNPIRRAYILLEHLKLRRWEKIICSEAAGLLACSFIDEDLFRSFCPKVPTTLVPNVVDTENYVPIRSDEERDVTVVYTGTMEWFPNQDAADFFVSEIWPQVHEQIPEAKFIVAGRNPPEEFRKRLSRVAGVEFTGSVPDMRPIIGNASVCVVPLRIGSGTRLKILEAAAMERPIVSTTLGAEGLAFQNGEEIILSDRPGDFSRAVIDLLRDPRRRALLGKAARKNVDEKYSLPVLRKALNIALASVKPAPPVDCEELSHSGVSD